jgi:ParB-like chromosome segregation protein Spo0J
MDLLFGRLDNEGARQMKLNQLTIDGGTQSRVKIIQEAVDEYAESLKAGARFPAVLVYFDGIKYYLTDGYHRYFAHQKAGIRDIEVIVNGTLRDAILRSKSVNAENGRHRTNEDKRNAVQGMLDDFEWQFWNDAEIAKACRVSITLVASVRGGNKPEVVKVNRNGKVFERKAKYDKPETDEPKHDQTGDVIKALADENDKLKDRLAVAVYAADESEKKLAEQTIMQLREDVRLLELELKSTRISRDTLLNENAAMKKQIAALQRQLKK